MPLTAERGRLAAARARQARERADEIAMRLAELATAGKAGGAGGAGGADTAGPPPAAARAVRQQFAGARQATAQLRAQQATERAALAYERAADLHAARGEEARAERDYERARAVRALLRAATASGWRTELLGETLRCFTPVRALDEAGAASLCQALAQAVTEPASWAILDLGEILFERVEDPAWVTQALAFARGRERVVVVLTADPRHAPELPPEVHVATTLIEARVLIDQLSAPAGDAGPGPGDALSATDRHTLAVRQSLRWAETAASEGDFDRALSWLATIEAVDGRLPEGWEERRIAWTGRRSVGEAEPAAD